MRRCSGRKSIGRSRIGEKTRKAVKEIKGAVSANKNDRRVRQEEVAAGRGEGDIVGRLVLMGPHGSSEDLSLEEFS